MIGRTVLLTSRTAARGQRPWPVFPRRSFWLPIFGLMHAYLLWSGDILVSYAISQCSGCQAAEEWAARRVFSKPTGVVKRPAMPKITRFYAISSAVEPPRAVRWWQ
jgi:uncharacterized membrane protein YeiB